MRAGRSDKAEEMRSHSMTSRMYELMRRIRNRVEKIWGEEVGSPEWKNNGGKAKQAGVTDCPCPFPFPPPPHIPPGRQQEGGAFNRQAPPLPPSFPPWESFSAFSTSEAKQGMGEAKGTDRPGLRMRWGGEASSQEEERGRGVDRSHGGEVEGGRDAQPAG